MIEVLSKPADQIGIRDIESLIHEQVPESEQIDFKESLSTKGGSIDPWMSGEGQIGNQAKKKILEGAVAFANAHGGALLLGIRESNTKPSVASEITPIPRCAELAESLKLTFRDCVEPQLSQIEIFGVPTQDNSGVVVIRVGTSRLAPHRVKKTLICPIRRQDRCEKMTMREIQDMTLNVSRGLERLDKQLSERAERFQQEEFKRLEIPDDAFGIRLTAAPMGDEIRIERVYRQRKLLEALKEPWHRIKRNKDDGTPWLLEEPNFWRPILRGARADHFEEQSYPPTILIPLRHDLYREIHCDGLIEIGYISCNKQDDDLWIDPRYLVVMFANLMCWAERVRSQALAPLAEYAVEVQIDIRGSALVPYMDGGLRQSDAARSHLKKKMVPGMTRFPRYSIGSSDEFNLLLNMLHLDFWHAFGSDFDIESNRLVIEDWPDQSSSKDL